MRCFVAALLLAASGLAGAQPVVDLATRPGVTERLAVLGPAQPRAVVLLLAGGEGRLEIADDGRPLRGGNFLVRSRERFAGQGLAVLVPDTPSDRSTPPFLGGGFRESAEHVADLGVAIAWAHDKYQLPVWVVGTSRGTESAAQAAIFLAGQQAPDGLVLTSTILASARRGDPGQPVPEMDLARIHVPVLVVHHADDPCAACLPSLLPGLMAKLPAGLAELKTYTGGSSRGPACEAFSYHGFNGIEDRVVADIAAWLLARK